MKTSRYGPRKAHSKSRNGCSQCRKARIKCDQQAPRCNHCSRRRLQCDFENEKTRLRTLTLPWVSSQHMFSQTNPRAQQHSLSVAKGQQNLASTAYFEHPHWAVMLEEPSAHPLDSAKSQIFHHFVAETSRTLESTGIPNGFWNIDIPRLALQNDYLLNAVLAISALHKCYLEHSNSHIPLDVNKSIMWHSKSVESFAHVVANITSENCVTALAMAAISAFYSLGLAQLLSSLKQREHIEQLIAIILAVRKAMQLFQPFTPWLNAHGVLLPGQKEEKPTQKSAVVSAATAARLSALISLSQVDSHDRQIYEETISALKDSDESSRLTMLPPSFLTLLRDKKPMAILILAAFSLNDEEAETTPWYLDLWRSKFREYFIEFLGPLWTQYISVGEDATCSSLSQTSVVCPI